MSGYYLFFRLCSSLNSTFPAKQLDEVRDKDLPSALDALAREWLEQHPGAVATAEEVTKLLTLGEDPAESCEVDLDELRWDIDEFLRELGVHPDQPLFLRVAPLAGWGWPLPQPLFSGQAVSERCFFARAPDRGTAESALDRIRRLAAKSFGGNWLEPHFGCCAESGFTKEERKTIEITYDLTDLRADSPSFVQEARRVLDKVMEVEARAKAVNRPKRRRRKADAVPRPLTAKQAEAIQIVGECKGNFSQAAARMGLDRATVRQHYNAGMGKLGRKAVKHGTQRLPSDKRGQDNVYSDDDRRV
jgi:hypothetical protein